VIKPRNIPVSFMDRITYHCSLHLVCNKSCPEHRLPKIPGQPSVSDHVLRTEFRSRTYTNRHATYHLSSTTTDLRNKVAIHLCVKELSNAISKAMAEFTSKWKPARLPTVPDADSYPGTNALE